MKKHLPVLEHYCADPLACPQCIRRFYLWAENYSHRHERPKPKRKKAP